MSNFDTITGTVTEVTTARHTYMGNPIKLVTIDFGTRSQSYETLPNAQLGYTAGNYVGKAVTVGFKTYRGGVRMESIEEL